MQQQYEKQLSDMQLKHKAEVEELKKGHAQALAQLQQQLDQALRQASELRDASKASAEQLQQLQQQKDAAAAELDRCVPYSSRAYDNRLSCWREFGSWRDFMCSAAQLLGLNVATTAPCSRSTKENRSLVSERHTTLKYLPFFDKLTVLYLLLYTTARC